MADNTQHLGTWIAWQAINRLAGLCLGEGNRHCYSKIFQININIRPQYGPIVLMNFKP
jgi:hypothetical protein